MEVVVRPNDDGSVMVAITGSINEYAQTQLKRILLQLTNPTKIEIELGRIEVINSIGTMYWMEFLKSLLRIAPVELSNCSITVVDNLNRLPSMMAGTTVSSIQIPFRCPDCRRIFSQFALSSDLIADGKFPDTMCDKCATPAEPEVDFEDYTIFTTFTA